MSLTYDDGLSSQLDIAVPQLDEAGLRGTFYVTWENIRDRAAEWAAIAKRGHQLANHTVTHPCDLARGRVGSFRSREIDPLQDWLANVEPEELRRDYAYPCDVTNLGPGPANQQLKRYIALLRSAKILRARTSEGPPNSLRWARRRPYQLHALALAYDTKGLDAVREYLAAALAHGHWAILVIHGLGDGTRSDGFIPSSEHQQLLTMIQDMRIPCGTIAAAADFAQRVPV